MSKYFFLFAIAYFISFSAVAQKTNVMWHVGYFAPYFSNIGGTIGCGFGLKELGRGSKEQIKSKQSLRLLTQLSYYTQINVSHNLLLHPELVYRWNKSGKRFFLFSSVGAGYLISFQKQEGTLNLGTGEADYTYKGLHYFLPTINIGLGVDPKKHLGFYLKTTYGRKISAKNAGAGFAGISAGLIIKFNSKD